ncbi:MAG: SGNH/GDSL hydrolase family protein, partial [Gemmatimonadaceae bacterium]
MALLVAGAALVLVAVLPELRNFGEGGFGRIQMLVLGVGLILVLVGWFGRRSAALYRDFTLIAINAVILLVLAELAAGFALRFMEPEVHVPTWKQSSYYVGRDWGEDYWREFEQVNEKTRYHPYIVWRRAPFHGRLIDVNDEGIRRTPGAACTPGAGALTVYAFGGSTMWGMGAPDWGTIPAYLESELSRRARGPVCVVNYAELGFVSTQGVIQLVRLLEAGTVPDVVIFYDGINDVATAHTYQRAGLHFQLPRIVSKLEGTAGSGERWFTHTSLYQLVRHSVLASRAGPAGGAGRAGDVS